jgi:hypothetical protein
MHLNFHLTQDDMPLVLAIARSASNLARSAGQEIPPMEFLMDLATTHNHACPLDFAAMAKGNPADVAHDVFGIRRHLDRETGLLTDCFLPRFAARQVEAAAPAILSVYDRGCHYQIEAGQVYVIKSRARPGREPLAIRQRITSAPKIKRLLKLAAR